jgi:hypothetical protein
MKKLMIAVAVLFIAGCGWDLNVNYSKIHPTEKLTIDTLDRYWSSKYFEAFASEMRQRLKSPNEAFEGLESTVIALEKTMTFYKNGIYKDSNKGKPTFKDVLPEDVYNRIFFVENVNSLGQTPAEFVEEFKEPTNETVNQQYIKVEQIEKLIEKSESCQGATDLMRAILREQKGLTLEDEKYILNEINYCATVELMNKVK